MRKGHTNHFRPVCPYLLRYFIKIKSKSEPLTCNKYMVRIILIWCEKRDLNPYGVTTRPSNVRVCQFRHSRIYCCLHNAIIILQSFFIVNTFLKKSFKYFCCFFYKKLLTNPESYDIIIKRLQLGVVAEQLSWLEQPVHTRQVMGSSPISATIGPLVKRLRHRPFTAVTGVRFSHGSPKKEHAPNPLCS